MKNKLRETDNCNIKINTQRVIREVMDNLKVQYVFTKREEKIILDTVKTTIWELFERKEERLREFLNGEDKHWEYKK